jgi:hypothetical protein
MEYLGNEVENLCKWLDGQPRNKMILKANRTTFVMLVMASKDLEDNPEFEAEYWSKASAEKILSSRLKALGYDMTAIANLGVILLMEPALVPGNLVIYANYLAYKCKESGTQKVRLDHVIKWFPMGGYHENTLQEFWNRQKSEGLNMVDMDEPTKSLRYESH